MVHQVRALLETQFNLYDLRLTWRAFLSVCSWLSQASHVCFQGLAWSTESCLLNRETRWRLLALEWSRKMDQRHPVWRLWPPLNLIPPKCLKEWISHHSGQDSQSGTRMTTEVKPWHGIQTNQSESSQPVSVLLRSWASKMLPATSLTWKMPTANLPLWINMLKLLTPKVDGRFLVNLVVAVQWANRLMFVPVVHSNSLT